MLPAYLYFTFHLCLCYLLIGGKIVHDGQYPYGILTRENGNIGKIKTYLLGLFYIIFFGLRPILNEVGPIYMGDTYGYASYYNLIKDGLIEGYFWLHDATDKQTEYVFMFIRDFMATNGFPVQLWFTLVASLYIIPKLVVIKRWFQGYEFLAILFVITAFGFYSGGVNGIRNACASSLFILGMSYLIAEERTTPQIIKGIIFCILAYYTHKSIIIPGLSLVASLFIIKDTKYAITIWFICILTSLALGNTIANWGAAFFDDDRATSYLLASENEDTMSGFAYTGFRWDFLLYSAMPILMGWYVIKVKGVKDKTYSMLVNTYILANSIWVIFIYASYSNRFAALSWAMYTYVLLYPLVRYDIWGNRQSQYTCFILLGQLLFVTFI